MWASERGPVPCATGGMPLQVQVRVQCRCSSPHYVTNEPTSQPAVLAVHTALVCFRDATIDCLGTWLQGFLILICPCANKFKRRALMIVAMAVTLCAL